MNHLDMSTLQALRHTRRIDKYTHPRPKLIPRQPKILCSNQIYHITVNQKINPMVPKILTVP